MNYSNMYNNNNPNPNGQYDWNFMSHSNNNNNNSMDLSEPLQEPVAFEGNKMEWFHGFHLL